MPKELIEAKIGMILGSGLAIFVEQMKNVTFLNYSKIEGWYHPSNKVVGHVERFALG